MQEEKKPDFITIQLLLYCSFNVMYVVTSTKFKVLFFRNKSGDFHSKSRDFHYYIKNREISAKSGDLEALINKQVAPRWLRETVVPPVGRTVGTARCRGSLQRATWAAPPEDCPSRRATWGRQRTGTTAAASADGCCGRDARRVRWGRERRPTTRSHSFWR